MMTTDPATPPAEFEAPTHEDYERLQKILNLHIAPASMEEDFDLEEFVSQYIDSKSSGHFALQRVIGAFQINSPQELAEQFDSIARVCMLYSEAMVVGLLFEREKHQEAWH